MSVALVAMLVASLFGCATPNRPVELPSTDTFDREQLKIHSDIQLPRRHRLLDDLTARRRDIAERLLLPMSDEPINVYLFDDEERFRKYLRQNYPSFPDRRAFFVKSDTDLKVFAHWGDFVAEDLRHEVTHGYLHSVIPSLPLWLDEGLAEYFEVPRGRNGFHRDHIIYLTGLARSNDWEPDLQRLESLTDPRELSQRDYAESWLWVHYLMETQPALRRLIQDQLARLRMTGDAKDLSLYVSEFAEDPSTELMAHLVTLADTLSQE